MPSECIAGKWRFTGYDAILPDRAVYLPLYKFWQPEPDPYAIIATDQPWNRWGNRYEGRVLVGDSVFAEPTTTIPQSYFTNTGPTDVIRWHLYHGGPHAQNRGAGTSAKLPVYRHNLAALRDLCQQQPGIGIILGNCGAEVAFHHLIPSPEQKHRELANLLCIDFICETGAMVKAFGGRPFWMPMERDLMIDAYHCDGRMGEAVKALGGVMVICSECSMFPRMTALYGTDDVDGRHLEGKDKDGNLVQVQHPDVAGMRDEKGCFVSWEKRKEDPYPYRVLLDYFREFEVWYCVGYDSHFLGGLDNLLTLHGAKACVY